MSNPFTPAPGYYRARLAWREGTIARFCKHPQRFCANLPRAPREPLRAIALVGDRARVVAVPWRGNYAVLRASVSRLVKRGQLYRPSERGEVGVQPAAVPRLPAPGRRGSLSQAEALRLPAPRSKYGSAGEPTPQSNTEKPVLAAGRSPLNRSSMILRSTTPDISQRPNARSLVDPVRSRADQRGGDRMTARGGRAGRSRGPVAQCGRAVTPAANSRKRRPGDDCPPTQPLIRAAARRLS